MFEFKSKIKECEGQYTNFIKMNPTVNLRHITPIWTQLNAAYQKLSHLWCKYMASSGFRREPVVLWLYGTTMIGKSAFIIWLVKTINEIMGTNWETFHICKGPDYWNGFAQQKIIIIDDFASYIGVEGCLDALAVMNLATCAPYNPSLAALDEKGIYANPAIVIVLSNHPSIPMNSGITDMTAFDRRRDIFAEVRWIEHEVCGITDKCEHFEKFRKAAKKSEADDDYETDDFSHLTFHLKNPIVNQPHTDPQGYKNSKSKRADGLYYKLNRHPDDVDVVNWKELAEMVVEKVKEKDAAYQKRLRDKERSDKKSGVVQESTVDVPHWEIKPNILINGPPGCGKSQMFLRFKTLLEKEDKPRTVLHIKTESEFEVFAQNNFETTKNVVIFDDLSTHLKSTLFPQFIEKVKERYDLLSEKLPLWICAANPVQLDDRLESHYSSLEALVMFYRRFIQIDCAFKRKRGISMWKRYSSADIESITEKKLNINDMVSFIRKGTCIQYTYDSLICHLQTFSPKLVSVPQVTELPTITDFTPDAVCKLKCSSKEFVDNFLNKSGSITTVINFMTGEGAEFYSKAGIDKMDIGRKILTTYRNVRAAAGCQFVDMYSFVLEAWTNDYLKEFRGNSYMMSFADVNFFIQTVCGEIQAGIYAPVNPELANMAIQATLTKELIESIDVAQVMIANLPPWFCLAMQCCSQVAKIGMTVVAATYVVRQNTLLFRAQKADKIVTEVKEKYMDEASVAVGTRFENAVSDVNEIPPMYPHSPGHTGTRQHATSVDRDPITKPDRAKRETDTPGKNFSCGGSKQRAPKGGISWRTTKEDFKIMGDVTNEVEMTATIKQQSVLLQQAYDPGLPSVLGAIMPNMVQLCDRKTKQRLCYGLMLYGKTGTTVAHLVHARDIEQVVAIDYKGTAYDVAISKESPEQDTLDFVITTKTCPPYRNIVKHLSCKDFAPQKGASVVLFTLNKDWFGGVPTAIIRNYNLEEERVFKADEAIHKVCGYSYVGTRTGYSIPNINTFDGDCGSVLLVCDPTWSGKVIGIHTAASTTVGYAREIYREQYEHAAKNQTLQVGPIKNLDMKTRIFGRFGEFVIPDHATDLEGHPVEAIGIIKQFIPSTTKLWLGPMPYGPKLYEPSLLSKFDSRSPQPGLDFMYDETMKWARPRAPISDEDCLELDHCFRAVGEHYGQIIKRHGCPIRVLSKTESINKLRGSMKSNPVLLSSSPGYPWNVFAQGGKKRFIEVDSQTGMRHFAKNQETSWLKNAVDDVISDARREEASYCVFKVCLKDELVKLKKIYEEPKTRTIAAAPLHLVIACRMFFHTVHAAIAECWPDVFAKVGIDAASLDWHAMFSRMLSKSERGFAFDFKGWDTCVPPEFTDRMWIFYDAVFSLCCPEYTPEMRSIIRGLYKNLSKFRFLLFQRVYLATGGVASGHPGTAIDNCIINTVNMYFAFRKIMKRVLPEYATWYYFLLFVDHADYGDDIFVAVVAWLLQHYNGVTVSKELEKIGWEVTSADKDKPITESILLWDCEFMSRGFERFYGLWVGPLREQQIVKCTHYVTTTKSHKFWRDQDKVFYQPEILADLAFVCLKEMFLHGEEKYNALRRHFIENFAKLGIPQYVPMYEEAYDNFMGSNLSYQSRHPSVETNLIEQGLDLPEWSIPESDKWNHFKNRSSICFGATYIYNGSQQPSEPTTGWPQEYLDLINTRLNKNFNSVLMNVYPPGGEIPYHRDNEREIDKKEGVACLTIQGDGVLQLRFKDQHRFLPQRPGTLYVLEREYLERWEHCRTDHREETVSLTFRKLEVPGR
uniref:Uncharacterized protein n=1 Tax=Picornavirales sp. TaxID=1955153 RepID=A0A6M3YNR6_9VIRU|nr:MAG: hypothetical protein 1 [Picornavirales sp.]